MPGFDMIFVNPLARYLYCPLCKLAMKEPVKITSCGHRFCDSCLQDFLR
ncbi:hypothetical protein LSH36_3g20009 [Paralvinella palmiformis]|uniref:RING-type domain-containing protein n=1 Tax=Paralvinella palmiformis TaxID=53620 RepID=A0AAD9KFU7_9ANNE|nr:hypothetical protein LSH36_3g20009 [Paralvinella palmiformis]